MVTRWPVGRLPSIHSADSTTSFFWARISAMAAIEPSGSIRLATSRRVTAVPMVAMVS
jgi:hypothetical protein